MSEETFCSNHLPLDNFQYYKATATGQVDLEHAYYKAYQVLAPTIDANSIKLILQGMMVESIKDRDKKIKQGPTKTPNYSRYEKLVAALVIFINIGNFKRMTIADIVETLFKLLARKKQTLKRLIYDVKIWLKPQLFDESQPRMIKPKKGVSVDKQVKCVEIQKEIANGSAKDARITEVKEAVSVEIQTEIVIGSAIDARITEVKETVSVEIQTKIVNESAIHQALKFKVQKDFEEKISESYKIYWDDFNQNLLPFMEHFCNKITTRSRDLDVVLAQKRRHLQEIMQQQQHSVDQLIQVKSQISALEKRQVLVDLKLSKPVKPLKKKG